MPELTPQQQYESHLPLIEQVIASTMRQYCLAGDDADEFRSQVHAHLTHEDYAVLRKFRGTSSLKTYLVVVIKNRFRDFYRAHRHGRWRPSAKAKKLGPLAVRLETMLYRDRRTRDEAFEILASGEQAPSRAELSRLAAQLPPRAPRRMDSPDALEQVAGSDRANGRLLEDERTEGLMRLEAVLERAMATLPDEDRLILRMRYRDGFTVARIARSLGLEQKPLYDRIERHLARLRQVLEGNGVTTQEVRELFE